MRTGVPAGAPRHERFDPIPRPKPMLRVEDAVHAVVAAECRHDFSFLDMAFVKCVGYAHCALYQVTILCRGLSLADAEAAEDVVEDLLVEGKLIDAR